MSQQENDNKNFFVSPLILIAHFYQIDDIERQGSEMDYLKQFGAYWRESGGHQDPKLNNPSQKFLEDHPRYMELVESNNQPIFFSKYQ